MAKRVKQFRYYSEENGLNMNYPSNINHKGLVSGESFSYYMPAYKIGI
jgi:hypothetical protein